MRQRELPEPIGKCSVYLGADASDALRARGAESGETRGLRTRSATINAMLDRYAYLMRSTPEMTKQEWLLVFDSLNGVILDGNASFVAAGLVAEVADNCVLNGADSQFDVPDWNEFVRRLQAMTPVEKLAIIDAAERFWCGAYEADTEEDGYLPILRALGCRVSANKAQVPTSE